MEMALEGMDEGALRLAVSQVAAERAGEMAAAGLLMGMQGKAELAAAAEDADIAAVTAGAEGAAEFGAAAAMADVNESADEATN